MNFKLTKGLSSAFHFAQVFMIDERTHSGMLAMRAGGGGGASLGGRMGDSMPDYDNVKVSWTMQIGPQTA